MISKFRFCKPFFLGVLLALLVAGCGLAPDDRVTVKLATWGSQDEIATLRDLLYRFEKAESEIRVELVHIPENYDQKLHLLFAANLAPDVLFLNSYQFPAYAQHGLLSDLTPYWNEELPEWRNDFYPQGLAPFRLKHEGIGALPRDLSNLVVFYNRELFNDAGLAEPKAGWRWHDFQHAAQVLTRGNIYGASFYGAPPLFWLPWVYGAGGRLIDATGDLALEEASARAGLEFYLGLLYPRALAPRPQQTGQTPMSQLFLQGKLGMMVSGRWSVPLLRKSAGFDWDVVALPAGPVGSHSPLDASGYALAKSSAHPDAAWRLIQFLTSQDSIAAFTRSGLIVPARQSVAEGPVFLEPSLPPAHAQAFLDAIQTGVPTQVSPQWVSLSHDLETELAPVWQGRQKLAPALERLDADW